MIAKLVHPLEVAVKDIHAVVVVTLPPGATVDFETTEDEDIVEVLCEEKVYTSRFLDLLDAAEPMEWSEDFTGVGAKGEDHR
jgi:hypothetical protein